MKKKLAFLVLLALAICAALFAARQLRSSGEPANELKVFGNVELRQVALAFDNTARITAILVDEGDAVQRGQVVARLDTSRIEPLLGQAKGQVAAQRAILDRLKNGARPEEIAQARAALAAAMADAMDATNRYQRLLSLSGSSGVSPQELDSSRAAAAAATAREALSRTTLDLVLAGPRREDIAEAEARLASQEAQVRLLDQQLADAELMAPVNAIVRTRILEPGDMASPQKPVLTLAVTEPKWIRTFVEEADLGRVHPGMTASVVADAFPKRRISGRVGFISSVAEFTPKTLQTEELRTSLVYEVRVLVDDPDNVLRLGMPVSVYLSLESAAQ